MITSYRNTWSRALAVLTMVACPAWLAAAEPAAATKNQPATSVEMFQGMKDGQLEVKLIQTSDREANILITNKTKQPLSVQVPEAWAGVPVLAQRGGGAARGAARGGAQRTGGGARGGGAAGGGGAFNVPPEKMTKIEVPTVCLDHGLANPTAKMAYEIKPIEEVTSDPRVHELLKLFGRGELDQRSTQAAAWHLANNMSWEELANEKIKHLGASPEPYFSRDQLQTALQIVAEAQRLASVHTPTPASSLKSE